VTTRLLFVTDDATRTDGALGAALRGQGYVLQHCAIGTAPSLLRQHAAAIDVVLLDVELAGIDGAALCRLVGEIAPRAVIVVLAARLDDADMVRALHAGADDYLTRPHRSPELFARLRAHLRRATGSLPPQ